MPEKDKSEKLVQEDTKMTDCVGNMIMVFEGMMIIGMVVGIVGIVMLLFLIPMCVGLKDNK